jgi:ABC-2 type transport system permease protein
VGTLLVQVVFGSLFDPNPRLGIVDEGDSEITSQALELGGIQVALLSSVAELKAQVEANDLDVGLVLQDDFDHALMAGELPDFEIYVGGESFASNRYILVITLIDLVRDLVGDPAPVDVQIESIGEGESIPVADRLIPFLVLFAVIISGLFVPAASIVDEKEHGTLSALLVTPVRTADVLLAKGAFALVLATSAGAVTLALNQAFGHEPLTLVLVLLVAALMTLLLGLIIGSLARNENMLYSVIKGGNILLMAPVIFFIWPDLPQWVAKLFPTYYFLNPVYQVAVKGAALEDIWGELVVAVLVCALLIPVVVWSGRRMTARLAAT